MDKLGTLSRQAPRLSLSLSRTWSRKFQKTVERSDNSFVQVTQSGSKKKGFKVPPPLPPPKIERGHTDILNALASTVGRDYTAAHYRYHDDPYLIPISNLDKRSFALSKESGRKAAKWIRQEHADLFTHKVAEPSVKAFYPNAVITEESEITEDMLKSLIRDLLVQDAIKVYSMLSSKGTVSRESKQALLELLAYYNETEPLDEEWTEERWYRTGQVDKERPKNTWNSSGLAETIFQELDPADGPTYCALIRGRAKYHNVSKAWELYNDVRSKGIIPDCSTYNQLIRVANFCKENSEMRWHVVEELLTDMSQNGVKPNLGTLNAVLETLSTIGNPRESRIFSLRALAEFKQLGIQPSLASYYYLLVTHCNEKGPASTILIDIMDIIENKSFTIQDPKDTHFFVTAMNICRYHLQDLDLAIRVDKLLHTGNNYDLIGDSFKESVYYRNFLALKCTFEPFETFMEFYNKYVPNIYTPEPGIMEEILKSLELNQAVKYIPPIWSDLVVFEHTHRESIVALVLRVSCSLCPTDNSTESKELQESLGEIGWKIWTIFETQDLDKGKKLFWTGHMLGDLMALLIKIDAYERSCEVIKKVLQTPQEILGVIPVESLQLFINDAIYRRDPPMCLACIQYASDVGFPEVIDMAEDVFSKVRLDPVQVARLSNIVGFDVTLQKSEKSETLKQNEKMA